MSEQFINLVSQANPATRQYQPTHNGYPPTTTYNHNSPEVMDPFFDDDDDFLDTAFGPQVGRSTHMHSQDSGLPLREGAVPPAGSGASKTTLAADGMSQGWTFDDDELQVPGGAPPFKGSAAFPGTNTPTEKGGTKSSWKKWKWPWQKEKKLTGERIIALNNTPMNVEFCSNFVSTSKYNMVSFVPKFLAGEYVHLFDIYLV